MVQEDGFIAASRGLGGHLHGHRGHTHGGSRASPPGIEANDGIRHDRGILLRLRCPRPLPTVLSTRAVEISGTSTHIGLSRCRTAARYSNRRAHNRPRTAADIQLTCLADHGSRRPPWFATGPGGEDVLRLPPDPPSLARAVACRIRCRRDADTRKRNGPRAAAPGGIVEDATAALGRLGQLAVHQCLGERLPAGAGVRHAFTDLPQGARSVSGATATALVETDTRVQQQSEHPPAGGVPTTRHGEGGADMDKRFGTTRAQPFVITDVRLLVGGPARQADVRGLRMRHAFRLRTGPARLHRISCRDRRATSVPGTSVLSGEVRGTTPCP